MKVLIIFGTRPEAIKMAHLSKVLKEQKSLDVKVCVTGQHRDMLDQVLTLFEITPDIDLNIMEIGQDLTSITANILTRLKDVFRAYTPDLVLVHGDTATTFAATLSSFYHKIKVGHIEAGLRTGNINSPWPEEANRRLVSLLTEYHFAPTETAKENLLSEGIPSSKIFVTGNTVIDSLLEMIKKIKKTSILNEKLANQFSFLNSYTHTVLITGHRRENFGIGFENMCLAIQKLASKHREICFVYPVHLNPNVREPVQRILNKNTNIFLIEPLSYDEFVYLMNQSYLILTDSGGIQEEAPSLGKPVLVMRDTTERPEAIKAGTVKLVGTDSDSIFEAVNELITNTSKYNKMSGAHNPYGNGDSCLQIAQIISTLPIVN